MFWSWIKLCLQRSLSDVDRWRVTRLSQVFLRCHFNSWSKMKENEINRPQVYFLIGEFGQGARYYYDWPKLRLRCVIKNKIKKGDDIVICPPFRFRPCQFKKNNEIKIAGSAGATFSWSRQKWRNGSKMARNVPHHSSRLSLYTLMLLYGQGWCEGDQ